MIQGINRSVIRQSIILIVKLMSFKTSVLIWFPRSCGTASPQPNPWEFCIRQKNMDFEDMVTEEHGGSNIVVRWNDNGAYFPMTW